jgi:23S rRNA pseudouridine2605 synthase
MRINKYIASRLGISRRKADEFIQNGRILVNGKLPTTGADISEYDTVLVDSKKLPDIKKYETLILNKPTGYVCSRNGQGSHTIYELIPDNLSFLNPVGRLDKDSSGLLLLTNDGQLHQKLTHPSYQKTKVYEITIDKNLSQDDKYKIEIGIKLSDGVSKLDIKEWQKNNKTTWIITMHEGRNRQIRRTFAKLGYSITSLNRIKFGDYELNNLKLGDFIKL